MSDSAAENKPIDNIWDGDLLGRKDEALSLQRYVENLYRLNKKGQTSFVLNINSEWGHGKTWFLTRLSQELAKNHPVVYFDAWKNDFSKDALLSFVSVVCEELGRTFSDHNDPVNLKIQAIKKVFSKVVKKTLPILTATAVKHLTGMAVSEFANLDVEQSEDGSLNNEIPKIAEQLTKIASACAVEEFTKKKKSINAFQDSIVELVEAVKESKNIHLPICIFVDELDRCRPTYAIEFLEAVKHLFSTKGIFFILATDTRQLSHSIKVVYGQNFNAAAYLKRFFYSEYNLIDPNYTNIANYLLTQSDLSSRLYLPNDLAREYRCAGIFALVAEYFILTVRDQEQVYAILESAVLTANRDNLHLVWLLYLICMKHKFEEKYSYLKGCLDGMEINKIHLMETKAVYLKLPTAQGVIQHENIGHLFMFYNDLRDKQLREPSSILGFRSNFYIEVDIARDLDHSLNDYFSFIDHAGFFKIS